MPEEAQLSQEEPPCPWCAGSLFEDNCDFYCWECDAQFCPVCLQPYGPTINEKDFPTCVHYVGDYSGASGSCLSSTGQDDGVLEQLQSLKDHASSVSGNSGWSREVLERSFARVKSMDDVEKRVHFGPLFSLLDAYDCLPTALTEFGFPFEISYIDMPAYVVTYFSSVGSTAIWARLAPAMKQYVGGLKWLQQTCSEAA